MQGCRRVRAFPKAGPFSLHLTARVCLLHRGGELSGWEATGSGGALSAETAAGARTGPQGGVVGVLVRPRTVGS